MDAIAIERVGPDDPGFGALRKRLLYPLPDDPVPGDATRMLARRGGGPVARLATVVRENLVGAPGRSGLIGHYEAGDPEAGVALLRSARERLFDAGVDRVLGPMNGSTWARYRLALPRGAEDPVFQPESFAGEPMNPPDYPGHFEGAGFSIVDSYESRIQTELTTSADRVRTGRRRLRAEGLTARALELDHYDAELRALYELSRAAFAGNPYYSPIDWPGFRALYATARARIDPELIRLVHDADGRLVAFVFAFPDALDPRGRIILKTLAVAPENRGLGLGGLLTAEVAQLAHEKGAPAVIHALMHVTNASTRISSRHSSRLFCRYALYGA